MNDLCSCQELARESDQIDLKVENTDTQLVKTSRTSTIIEMELRKVITQGELDILTTWFPKAAQTLANVLRNRPHRFRPSETLTSGVA